MSSIKPVIGSDRNPNLSLIPASAWDAHMHIFSPDALPASKLASLPYTPPEATIPQANDVLGKIGKRLRMCVVQPSVYGTDNEVTIGGVEALGKMPRSTEDEGDSDGAVGAWVGCAVVELDVKNTIGEMLQTYHERGVRGVR
jgi:predicted TIM-barrel fold metal-dependent hydrolase